MLMSLGFFPSFVLLHVCMLVLLAVSLLVRWCIDWSLLRYPLTYSTVKKENPVQMGTVFKGKTVKGKPITLLFLCVYSEIRFYLLASTPIFEWQGCFAEVCGLPFRINSISLVGLVFSLWPLACCVVFCWLGFVFRGSGFLH